MDEDQLARRIFEAAQQGYPNDINAQLRNIANARRVLGIGVTLRALMLIVRQPEVHKPLLDRLPES